MKRIFENFLDKNNYIIINMKLFEHCVYYNLKKTIKKKTIIFTFRISLNIDNMYYEKNILKNLNDDFQLYKEYADTIPSKKNDNIYDFRMSDFI